MKKRLRKKLRKGEFKELGFNIRFKVNVDFNLEEDIFDKIFDDFCMKAEELNLNCTGGGTLEELEFCIALNEKRGSITIAQRDALVKWLKTLDKVSNIEITPLFDLWYNDENTENYNEAI